MIRLHVLGECRIEADGGRIGPDSERLFAALLYLAMQRGRSVPRGALIHLLWPGAPEENGRHNLRQTIYKARRQGAALECTQTNLLLPADGVDAGLLGVLEAALASGDLGGDLPSGLGEFLPGYAPSFSAPLAEWLEEQRGYVHAQLRRALLGAMAAHRGGGRWAAVERVARDVLRVDPLNEEATLALAEATALTGGKVQALAILDRYLHELGASVADVKLPATVLRRRIAERLPQHRYRAPSDSYFFGRAESLAYLTSLLQSARGGRGRGCIVWGPPGIGKTRLGAEFFKVAALQGARSLRAVCQPSDARRPLSVWVDTVPALLRLPGAVGIDPGCLPYLKRLTEHDANATAPSPDAREAEYLYANVRRALFDLLDAVAAECCLVLLVEDAHWLDAMSWELLRAMTAWAETRRILFVLTSREAHAEPVAGGPVRGLERHALPALDGEAALALLAALAGERERAATVPFTEWALRVADGNPLFLRELATAWADSGVLPLVPASLATLLDDRLGRLSATAARLLQACALLGKQATLPRLERMLDLAPQQLVDGVDELEAHGMLAPDAARVPAKHELLSDRVLARVGDGTRALLHRRAGLILESEIEATGSAALLWDGAAHWRAAGEPERAVRLALLCAAHLMEVGLPGDAAEVYERGMGLCSTLSEQLQFHDGLIAALHTWGQWQRLLTAIEAKRRTMKAGNLDVSHDRDSLRLLEAKWRLDYDILHLISDVYQFAKDHFAAPTDRIEALSWGLIFADNICASSEMECLYEMSASLRDQPSIDEASNERLRLIYHTGIGDLDQGVSSAERLVAIERTRNQPARVARALRNAAVAFRRAGHYERSLQALQEALSLSEQRRYASTALSVCDQACSIMLDLDDIEGAKQWYVRAQQWAPQTEDVISIGSLENVRLRLALTQRKADAQPVVMHIDSERVLRDPILRRRADTEAMWLRTRMANHMDITDDPLLSDLIAIHPRCRAVGGHDFCALTLYQALSYIGRESDAERLLREYVTIYRREHSPLLLPDTSSNETIKERSAPAPE